MTVLDDLAVQVNFRILARSARLEALSPVQSRGTFGKPGTDATKEACLRKADTREGRTARQKEAALEIAFSPVINHP